MKRLFKPKSLGSLVLSSGLLLLLVNWLTGSVSVPNAPGPVSLIGQKAMMAGPNDIMVAVFQDFNGDGVRRVTTEPLIPGLTVIAYDGNNNQVAQDNVGTGGNYVLPVGAGAGPFRVEVTGIPANLQPGAVGTSTVFFASANETVAVALEDPDVYSQDNPDLVTTCFIEGPQPGGTGETFIRFGYESGCVDANFDGICDNFGETFTAPIQKLADSDDIGSTFGVAYQRQTRSAFVASFMKRHAGFKSKGRSGVIYRIQDPNTNSPTVTEYIDFDALGIPTQPATGDPHPDDNASQVEWERDSDSWDWVGKMSFGDLDISEDGETLFVVNLFDRRLYYFPAKATPYTAADVGMIQSVLLPQPCGNGIDARPFGLGIKDGLVYFSVTCTGESTIGTWAGGPIPAIGPCDANTPPAGNRNALSARIYTFDPGTGTVSGAPVLNFPLNYGRGLAINSGSGRTSATWNPWVTEWTVFNRPPSGTNFFQDRAYPQPMLSDIEFDGDNMVIGIRDRFGDQTGHLQRPPLGFSVNVDNTPPISELNGLHDGVAEGDILRACGDPTNGWTLESGGACGGVNGAPAPNANSNGPGGGEYYAQDDYTNFHNEITQGGMVVVPGQEEVATIMTDPINDINEFYDAGVVWYRNRDGLRIRNFLVFSTADIVADPNNGPTFAKANGLGDMIALADPTPIQIGNRVWFDDDESGIQDPGEPGINGVLVELYKDIGGTMTKVAETTTASSVTQGDGAFKFTNSTEQTWFAGETEVLPNMSYEIRVSLANVTAQMPTVNAFSDQNASGDATNGNKTDLNDSDADNTGVIAFTTGDAGENNHTLDIGAVARPVCDLAIDDVIPSTCDPATNTYSLSVEVTYSTGPAGEDIRITTDNGVDMTFTPAGTAGTETFVINGITSDGVTNIDVTAAYVTTTSCADTATDEYDAPADCTPPCELSITAVNPVCIFDPATGQSTFDVEVTLAYNYPVLAVTPDVVDVTIDGMTVQSASLNAASGSTTVTINNVAGPAYNLPIIAAFANTATCTAATAVDLIACTDPCTTTLGGNVFNDFDNNGADAGAGEPGQENVLVEIYQCDEDTPIATTWTNADGYWSVDDAGLTYPVRVEFSTPLQPYLQPSYAGTDNGTNTQFVDGSDCNVDYGVNTEGSCSVSDGTQMSGDVSIVIPCYISGAINDPGLPGEVLVAYDYDDSGTAAPTVLATKDEIGSVWGTAFAQQRQRIYTSAFLKRHVGLGPNGLGAIYQHDLTTGANSLLVDLAMLGINVGTVVNRDLVVGQAVSYDVDAYSKVGKVGFGDMEVSEDGQTLYVVGLATKTLYAIDIDNPTSVQSFPIPDPGCVGGEWRPFAVASYQGDIYVGGICDASTSENTDDLDAHIYQFDGNQFAEFFSMDLDFSKGAPGNIGCPNRGDWLPWTDVFNDVSSSPQCGNQTGRRVYPTPILSDIEFDVDGSMILGFIDRTSHQIGTGNYRPDPNMMATTIWSTFAGGDILRVCNVNGQLLLEGTPGSGCITPGNQNNQGPFGREYYRGDAFFNTNASNFPHAEISNGGLAFLPGSGEVIFSCYDPINGGPSQFGTGGTRALSNATGNLTRGKRVYDLDDNGSFGKGHGIGDVELYCAGASIQIGNYVWLDLNEDGVQDACEPPVADMPVTLYTKDPSGELTQVATTTTDATTGEYYFSDVLPDTTYLIVFGDAPLADSAFLANGEEYGLTSYQTGTGNNPSLNDSDATFTITPLGNLPAICYSTRDTTDHTLDVGLTPPVCRTTIMATEVSSCISNQFSFTVALDWTLAPATGDLEFSVDGGPYQTLTRTNFDTEATGVNVVMNGLTCNSANTVRIRFVDAPDCFHDAQFVFPPTDPAGYIYCEDTGEIVPGGTVTVFPPPGGTAQFLNGEDGSSGRYAWVATGAPVTAGRYTMVYNPPGDEAIAFGPGGFGDGDLILDPTAGEGDNLGGLDPLLLGSDVNGAGDTLLDPSRANNPYFLSFDLEAGDAFVDLNNIPLICTETCVDDPQTVGGMVFLDEENDGSMAGDAGQAGVQVELYDCDGNLVCAALTNAAGGWSCDGLNENEEYRVEFSIPDELGLLPGAAGVDNASNVQFVTAGTCSANYGVTLESPICDPQFIFTPCYVAGDSDNSSTPSDAFLRFNYDASGDLGSAANNASNKITLATKQQVGSTWGVAFDYERDQIYASAVLKAQTGMGPGGLGAIYSISPDGTTTPSLLIDIPNVGTIPDDATRGLRRPRDRANDFEAVEKIAKVGLGDIDISDDHQTLYVTNLFTREIVIVDIATATVTGSVPVPDPGCVNGDYRPWALRVEGQSLFLGLVCDASAGTFNDLEAFVYRMDLSTNLIDATPVLNFPLNHDRDAAWNSSPGSSARWHAWFADAMFSTWFNQDRLSLPSPVLSDIEFDDNGNMILGFMDRSAFQLDRGSRFQTATGTVNLRFFAAGGDIMRATADGDGSYTIEPQNFPPVTGNDTSEPEFFFDDRLNDRNHQETALGGLLAIMGTGEVVTTSYDLFGVFEQGISTYSTADGSTVREYVVFDNGSGTGVNGKGTGLGDLEAFCEFVELPLQIGNYVWIDADNDGVQDPCESPVEGVFVTLVDKTTGNVVDVDTTDANGNYYFTEGEGVIRDSSYFVVFGYNPNEVTQQYDPIEGELTVNGVAYEFTQADTGEGNNPEWNDSDATIMNVTGLGDFPSTMVNNLRETDHTLDAGLTPAALTSIGSTVFVDNNNNAMQDAGDQGIEGVELLIYQVVGGQDGNGNTETDDILLDVGSDGDLTTPTDGMNHATNAQGDYLFQGLPPGDYYIVIASDQFGAGEDLAMTPISSTDIGTTVGDNETDSDDNGQQAGGSGTNVTSSVITLSIGGEPTDTGTNPEDGQAGDQDNAGGALVDENGDMTIDFGFFAPVAVGDTAFVDLDGDGLQSPGDPGVGGVTVTLLDENGDQVTEDAEGNPITGTTMTAADGSYRFDNLPPGVYSVTFDISTADNAEFYDFTTANAGDDADDSDNSIPVNATTAQSDPTPFLNSGEEDLTLDVGLLCAIEVTVADPFAVCSTQPIDLTSDASITPATLGGSWSSSGDGMFYDAAGDVIAGTAIFGTAVEYRPGAQDIANGEVTLTLTTNEPDGPCEAVSASVTVQVLKADCGTFPWDGN